MLLEIVTIFMGAGKSVFMPIINWISILNVDGQTDEELASVAKKRMDVVSELEVTIDGYPLKKDSSDTGPDLPFLI